MSAWLVLRKTILFLLLLGSGFLVGYFARHDAQPVGVDPHGIAEEDEHDDEHIEEGVVHLTEEAVFNLDLQFGKITASDYFRYIVVPGEIIEKPGHSDHAVAAPVDGVVTAVHVSPGQAVQPGASLFDLQVTDEALSNAQIELLDVLTRTEVVDAELRRLAPLVSSGTVSGKRQIELEYERKQLTAKQNLHVQQLLARGLDNLQVDVIIEERQLLRTLPIALTPQHSHGRAVAADTAQTRSPDLPQSVFPAGYLEPVGDGWDYTVEVLQVFPGKSVKRGDDLCHVAYHTVLYIQGQAFEGDLEAITNLDEYGWTVTAEFGIHGRDSTRENLRVLFLDNHVDPQSQTFHFYVPLDNEVVRDTRDAEGNRYRTWKFKPGQRLHVRIPTEKWEQQVKLPKDAIVQDGPEVYVYRLLDDLHGHGHEAKEHDENDHHHDSIELERVPVKLLHRDDRFAILADDGRLQIGDTITMNAAYQVHLAGKVQSSGGAGHDHHHH